MLSSFTPRDDKLSAWSNCSGMVYRGKELKHFLRGDIRGSTYQSEFFQQHP